MKVNLTIKDDLMRRADDFAHENYMTRSGLVGLALSQYLNQQQTYTAIMDLAVAMRKIADTGKIDEETLQTLQDFERLSKMLTGVDLRG